METILSSLGLVAISEMGDKTQLLAFSLTARYKKPLPILAGIFVATVLNHALASAVGSWVSSYLGRELMAWILGISFIVFGLWTLKPDELEEERKHPALGAFFTTAVLFFLAEMGDKTQLATVALAARYQSAILVTIGTTLGMMVSDGLAVFIGEKLGENLPMNWIRRAAAVVFFIFGAVSILDAVISRG